MEKYTFLLIAISFLSGYVAKSIKYNLSVYGKAGVFVSSIALNCLKLAGTCVYKVSLVDKLCVLAVETAEDEEIAKIYRNQFMETFVEWKKAFVSDFHNNYPEEYQWQLEFDDWNGAMEELTHIYSKSVE